MRFYRENHQYHCGIDLHARSMYVCILDPDGEKAVHRQIPCDPDRFLELVEPYRDDIVVGVECLFCWYWVADLCADEDIPFVLGHAYYMKAIHGAKSKNDRIDSYKIASLLRGGNFPIAYVYPRHMRSTRDLLRRRLFFTRKRAELLSHIQNTNTQYNLEPYGKRIDHAPNRDELLEHFAEDENVQMSIAANMAVMDTLEETITELKIFLTQQVQIHDASAFYLLKSIPGVGRILALTLIYEIQTIDRFPRVQDFLSYSRLVFSEAAALFLRDNPDGKRLRSRLERKHGKAKAMSILAAKLGRAVYFMLRRHQPFDFDRFVNAYRGGERVSRPHNWSHQGRAFEDLTTRSNPMYRRLLRHRRVHDRSWVRSPAAVAVDWTPAPAPPSSSDRPTGESDLGF